MNAIEEKVREIAGFVKQDYSLVNSGLFTGNSGVALFLFYYWKVMNDDDAYKKASALLMDIIDSVNKKNFNEYDSVSFSYCHGISGIAWLINHLIDNRIIEGHVDSILGGADKNIYVFMMNNILEGRYDFLHHALGSALYFLNRDNSVSKQYTYDFIAALQNCAIRKDAGFAWLDSNGCINLGLSHGLPSIIVYLCKVFEKYGNVYGIKDYIRKICDFVISEKQDITFYKSYFPIMLSVSDAPSYRNGRLAWCYGDLGVLIAFWRASFVLNDEGLRNLSVELLGRISLERDVQENMVWDAGLCHGAAGIAHIFDKMYRHIGDEKIKSAAQFWYQDVLNKSSFEDGLAGYKVWRTQESGGAFNQYGLLEGIAGIGLSLLSYISEEHIYWDESFLLS